MHFEQAFNAFKDTLSHEEHVNHTHGVLQRVGMTHEKNNDELVCPPSSVIMACLLQHGYGIVPGATKRTASKCVNEQEPYPIRHLKEHVLLRGLDKNLPFPCIHNGI